MNNSKYIDHTILKPDATKEDIRKICKEAIENNFCSICINPCYIALAKEILKNSNVKVCTVIGFPLGAMTTKAKVYETVDAISCGADEIDMVINIGALKDKKYDYLLNEIKLIKQECKDKILKVIIETCLLTDEEKIKICEIAKEAGADFVKTSTGFSSYGAKVEDVALMKKTVGNSLGVKASGGIKTKDDFKKMINAGASRIGTSSGVKIVRQ